jgi:hypothetical protein
MKTMNSEELLHNIRQLDPPSFLFARIEERIAQRRQQRVPKTWYAVAGALSVALLIFNVTAFRGARAQHRDNASYMQPFANELGLAVTNQLYR